MTNTNEAKVREQFEAWASIRHKDETWAVEAGLFRREANGEYVIRWIEKEWEVWQASRDSLVVWLPNDHGPVGSFYGDGVDACRAYIEEQGVKCE